MQRNAQLAKPVVFLFSNPSVYGGTGEIIMGISENFPTPAGFEKVVCRTVAEAERWSGRMRQWDAAKEQIAQAYQRHKETEQYEKICSEMRSNIANARNQINRDFAIQAYENFKKNFDERMKGMERTSYLHSEAFEADDKSVAAPKVRFPTKQHFRDIADFED